MEQTYIKPEAIKDSSLPIEKIDNVALDLADKVNALSDEGKNTFLNKIGLGKIGVISQKQNWTSDYSSYTISDVVRGIIPQYIIDIWERLSSKSKFDSNVDFRYNQETGYFECNNLVDITLNDAVDIILYGDAQSYQRKKYSRDTRVVFCSNLDGNWSSKNNIGIPRQTVERIYCQSWRGPKRCYYMDTEELYGLSFLKEIYDVSLKGASNSINVNSAYALTKFLAVDLKKNISISNSPFLSNESILFLIENESSSSAITITLHPDAYARATADADIIAALGQHKNIELASA